MKQFQINGAYHALRRLSEVKLPLKKAYEIYVLTKKVDVPFKFALAQEQKLFEKYNCEIKSDGQVVFNRKEDQSRFQLEISELSDMDVELEITPTVISCSDIEEGALSPMDISLLEGFVEFCE